MTGPTLSSERDDDLPIALRRTRRAGTPSRKPSVSPAPRAHAGESAESVRRSKRVRFSEGGQLPSSTGITPLVRRTGLATPPPSKTKRHSAPEPAADDADSHNQPPSPPSSSPLHQVIGGRIRRRPQRSGLGEKLDNASCERLHNRQKLAEEVERLRRDVQARDHEISELKTATMAAGGAGRIWDLEAQIEALTRQLADERGQQAKGEGGEEVKMEPGVGEDAKMEPEVDSRCRDTHSREDHDRDSADRGRESDSPRGRPDRAYARQATPSLHPPPLDELAWTPGSLAGARGAEWTMLSRSPLAVGTYDADAVMGDTEETPTEVNTDDDDDNASQDTTMSDILGDKSRPPVCRMIVWPTASPQKQGEGGDAKGEAAAQGGSGGSGLLSPSCARKPQAARMLSATSTSIRARSPSGVRAPFARFGALGGPSPRAATPAPGSRPTTPAPVSRASTPAPVSSVSTPTRASPDRDSPTPTATPTRRRSVASAGSPTPIYTDDADEQTMRQELESLQRELGKLSATVESYGSLHERLARRVSDVAGLELQGAGGGGPEQLEQQFESLLTLLNDRATLITNVTASLSALGFQGSDALEMVTSLSSALRSARMEIEYLTPCETAPAQVCIHGAQVLDLALSRLRELGRRATENEAGLHQQLAAGAKAVATLNGEIARAQALIHEKTFRITELEDTVETLKSVVGGYAGNVERLEDHVQRAQHDACEAQAVYARQLAQKEQRLQALNAQLASARQTAGALGGHVAAMATRHECVLAERDARLGQLRGEIERLAGAVKQLRRENGTLKTRLQERQPLADAPSQSQNQQQHQHQQHHLQNQNHLPTPKMDSAAVFGADGGDAMDSDEDMGVAVGKRRAFAYQRAQADSVMAMGCDEMR